MIREFVILVCLLCTALVITSLGCYPSSSVVYETEEDTVTATEAQHRAALAEQEKTHAELRERYESEIRKLKFEREQLRDVVAALQNAINGLQSQIVENRTIEVVLSKTITLQAQGDFEIVIEDFKDKASLPLKVNYADWSEAQIPRIRRIAVNRKASVHDHLVDILCQANLVRVDSITDPRMQAVYVIAPADTPAKGEIVITTRKRASERGTLPECFVP